MVLMFELSAFELKLLIWLAVPIRTRPSAGRAPEACTLANSAAVPVATTGSNYGKGSCKLDSHHHIHMFKLIMLLLL